MSTLIIYFDDSKKNFRKITPFAQGSDYDSKTRFDGRWDRLAEHLDGENIWRTEIV